MEEVIIVPVILFTFYLIIELFTHRKERLTIVEKAMQNQSVDLSGMLKSSSPTFSGIKIGCLLVGLGMGFLAAFLIDNYLSIDGYDGMVSTACVLIFGGLGLIVASIVDKKK